MSLLAEKSANRASPERLFAEEQAEIIAGLSDDPKHISPKYFYDQRGSELFDAICELPEYYPTRTEHAIMQRHMAEIAELIGPEAAVIEFGAGSNVKARQLLAGLIDPAAYVPVEISGDYLSEQAESLQAEFPSLSIQPLVADFTKPFDLPRHAKAPRRNLVFFPGSTIGNFTHEDAQHLLEVMRSVAKPGGALLIGVDLIKDAAVLHDAYNDSQGVTAAFNLNVLHHLNEGLGANFHPGHFRHEAVYDTRHQRIEMRLISEQHQYVTIANTLIEFAQGERIVTEYSHKYSLDGFRALAASAGLVPETVWTDEQQLFSVHLLTAPP